MPGMRTTKESHAAHVVALAARPQPKPTLYLQDSDAEVSLYPERPTEE